MSNAETAAIERENAQRSFAYARALGIKDKVIVITGASSGIGKATAAMLAAKGAKVVAGARRKENLEALVEKLASDGYTASYQVTDVAKRGDVENLVQHAINTCGKIDVIINNAGITPLSYLKKLKVDEWEEMQVLDRNMAKMMIALIQYMPEYAKPCRGGIGRRSRSPGFIGFTVLLGTGMNIMYYEIHHGEEYVHARNRYSNFPRGFHPGQAAVGC